MNRTAKCSHNERHAAILEQLVLPAATWVCLKNTYICKLAKLIYRGKKKKSEVREVEAEISQERDSCRGDGDALCADRSWDTECCYDLCISWYISFTSKKEKEPQTNTGLWLLLLLLFSRPVLSLCDPMECSTPGLPVSHHLLKFA